jgi:hypothetical protein
MAAELEADLEEVEAEGASPEAVLGSGAFDPQSFAIAWAAERGVIQRPLPSGRRLRWRSRIPAAVAALALIPAIIGAVLLIVASPSESQPFVRSPAGDLAVWVAPGTALPPAEQARLQAEQARLQTVLAERAQLESRVLVVAGETNGSGDDNRTLGSVLLIVGLAGIVPLTLFWLWIGRGRRMNGP